MRSANINDDDDDSRFYDVVLEHKIKTRWERKSAKRGVGIFCAALHVPGTGYKRQAKRHDRKRNEERGGTRPRPNFMLQRLATPVTCGDNASPFHKTKKPPHFTVYPSIGLSFSTVQQF